MTEHFVGISRYDQSKCAYYNHDSQTQQKYSDEQNIFASSDLENFIVLVAIEVRDFLTDLMDVVESEHERPEDQSLENTDC